MSRLAVTLCLAAFAAAVLLNVQQIAWWVTPMALGSAAWRARASQTHRLPSRMQRVALVLVLTVASVVSLRSLNGLGAGATLLTAMAAAKLSETARTRDWAIVLGTAFFLLVTACLDSQALWRLPLYLAALWLLCTAMRALGGDQGGAVAAWPLARRAGRALLWSLPLAALLFLFFPRLPGGFWTLPRNDEATTGLADEMSPGSISRLSESDEPALRVRFEGPLPPPAERYWRGPVLHAFDGYTWSRRPGQGGRPPRLHGTGTSYRYEATLEPASHGVLIALELPLDGSTIGGYTQYTGDYQLLTPRPLTQARTYRLESWPEHTDDTPLSTAMRRLDLALPAGRNPRTRELATQLRAAADGDEAFAQAALEYMKRGGLAYTLTPPKLSLDSVDEFLFDTKQGFCGHFASTFATLMRAGGVPARVVTGYLGGEWNPLGGYLLLRQSHAHAWTEVWFEGRGWTRIDPTVAVAPERLTRDVFDLIDGARNPAGRVLRATPWLRGLVQSVEALGAWWQDRVIGFDFRSQLALLERLGFKDSDWRALALFLGGGATLWLLVIAWGLRDALRRTRRDALARAWLALERRLARTGLPRRSDEGPLDYARRVGAAAPALAAPVQAIARDYADLRYGDAAPDAAARIAALRARIRALPR